MPLGAGSRLDLAICAALRRACLHIHHSSHARSSSRNTPSPPAAGSDLRSPRVLGLGVFRLSGTSTSLDVRKRCCSPPPSSGDC